MHENVTCYNFFVLKNKYKNNKFLKNQSKIYWEIQELMNHLAQK